ncbi:hypothetical protein ACCS64_39070, partial [Rhizobium ruizarguesonis]
TDDIGQEDAVHLAAFGGLGKLCPVVEIGGVYDVYKGSPAPVIETGAQIPVNDPMIPISAMAYVTKHLGFGVTVNTTYEPPFLL